MTYTPEYKAKMMELLDPSENDLMLVVRLFELYIYARTLGSDYADFKSAMEQFFHKPTSRQYTDAKEAYKDMIEGTLIFMKEHQDIDDMMGTVDWYESGTGKRYVLEPVSKFYS